MHNFSAFVVMPLFAFANAGVKIELSLQHAEIGFRILAGRSLSGKPLRIMMAALIAVRTGIAKASSSYKLEILARLWVSRWNRFHHVTIHCHAGVRRHRFGLTQLNEALSLLPFLPELPVR